MTNVAIGRSAVAYLFASAVFAGRVEAQDTTVIHNVRVFDGRDVIPNATVAFSGGRVLSVTRGGPRPNGARVIDGRGRTLLPGLTDAHTHTFTPGALQTALVYGVSTVLDMFTPVELARRWRAEQRSGAALDRATLHSAGTVVTARGGHGTQFGIPIPTLESAAAADSFVRARAAEGSEYIKIIYDDGRAYGRRIPSLDRERLFAAVAAARRAGRLAVVHVSSLAEARDAVAAGAGGLVHVWIDSVPDSRLLAEMVRKRMFVVPTLSVAESMTGTPGAAVLLRDSSVVAVSGQRSGRSCPGHFHPAHHTHSRRCSGQPGCCIRQECEFWQAATRRTPVPRTGYRCTVSSSSLCAPG